MKDIILKLKALLATVTFDAAKKAEIEAEIARLETESQKPPAQPTPATAPTAVKPGEATTVPLPPEIVAALGELKTLREIVTKQEERAVAQEAAAKAAKEADGKKRLTDYEKKITETEKKVTPAEFKEKWLPLLEANYDAAVKIIDALPVHPASKTPAKTPGGKTEQKTGIEKSAPKAIMDKVLEYANVSEN